MVPPRTALALMRKPWRRAAGVLVLAAVATLDGALADLGARLRAGRSARCWGPGERFARPVVQPLPACKEGKKEGHLESASP